MPISVQCDNCGQRYKVRDELAGARKRCRICGTVLEVPVPAEMTAAQIIRHERRAREVELAVGDSHAIEQISSHIERYIGPIESVYHEMVSDLVHIDIHFVAATDERPFHTLVTSGMSDRPMTVPEGAEGLRYAELMLGLPRDWPLSEQDFESEDNYWPIRCLKFLARLPHEYETWLGCGHTVPNGEPAEHFADNTRFSCCLIAPPVLAAESFHRLLIDDEKVIHFYAVIPLYREETEFKIQRGADALVERLLRNDVTEVIDLSRPSVCR